MRQQATSNTPQQMQRIYESLQPGDMMSGSFRSGAATGQGFQGDGDSIGKFDLGGVSLPNGMGIGGTRIEWSIIAEQGMPALVVLGGLAILAGAVIGFAAKRPRTGVGLALGGGALIWLAFMAKEQPELLALGGILAVALFGWFGWSEWKQAKAKQAETDRANQEHKALSIVTKAVEGSPDDVQAEVKKRVVGLGGLAVKDTITNAKVSA